MPEVRPIDANALTDKLQRSQAKAFMNQSWEIAGCIEAFIRMIDEQPTIEAESGRRKWSVTNGRPRIQSGRVSRGENTDRAEGAGAHGE